MPPVPSSPDLVIVGAGILGLSHAAAALARGLSVTVVDRSPTGAATGATVRNFGLLTSMYADGGVWGARAARSRALYESWAARGWVHLTRTGALQLAESEPQARVLRAYAASAAARADGVALVDAAQARELCPALVAGPAAARPAAARLRGALHFPHDALLEPRLLARGLPSQLERGFNNDDATGAAAGGRVRFVWGDAAARLRPDGPAGTGVVLTTVRGEEVRARHAVICTGDDVVSLLPELFRQEARSLASCKLQMMRIALPSGAGAGLTMPVTSGLSMRRYPLLAAACPAEHGSMMRDDEEGADGEAERLGIHIIARPAGAVPRGPFGEALPRGSGASPGGLGLVPLCANEAIVGDSHQYAGVLPPGEGEAAPSSLDEVIDEGVTDVMLRVAGGMLSGVAELRGTRMRGAGAGAGAGPAARILQQWQGVYLQHKDGVLATSLVLDAGGGGGGRGPNHTPFSRLSEAEAGAEARAGRAVVRVVTGIGGKGMTMSPALGEETIEGLVG
jgi:D-hydroxyproline dehydrogenase subunit beta